MLKKLLILIFLMIGSCSAQTVNSFDGTNLYWNDNHRTEQRTGIMLQPVYCRDSSGSATAQYCITDAPLTIQVGTSITYFPGTTNTGGLTLNVDNVGPVAVTKWLGTALASGDLPANIPQIITYDGSHWNVYTIGNAPAGGGTIGGSVANGQIAFGSGVNTIQGSANGTLDTSGNMILAGTFSATGTVDGLAPVTLTTGATASIGGTFKSGYTYNQEATPSTAVTYTLPTAAIGKQYCIANISNGTNPTTGALKLATSASGQFLDYNGTLSLTGGFIISAGAAGDKGCAVAISSTVWEFYAQVGTWTLH